MKNVTISISLLSPKDFMLSYEAVRMWAEAGNPEWAKWTDQMVIDHNVKLMLEHEAGKRYAHMRMDVFSPEADDAFGKQGWVKVPNDVQGVHTSWRSPAIETSEQCTACVDAAIKALTAIRGLTYEQVIEGGKSDV